MQGAVRPLVAYSCLLLSAPALAQTWNNPSGGNWATGSNWVGGSAPTPGTTTDLVFGSPATQAATYTATNNIGAAGAAFDLNDLSFNNISGTVTLNGNPLRLTGTAPFITVASAGNVVFQSAVNLASDPISLDGSAGSGVGSITLAGGVTGGSFFKDHSGLLRITGGGNFRSIFASRGMTEITSPLSLQSSLVVGSTFLAPSANSNVSVVSVPVTATGSVQVGFAANVQGLLTISGGASVTSPQLLIGTSGGTNGMVFVSGSGSRFDNVGSISGLSVGDLGTGRLELQSGASSSVQFVDVASAAGSSGTINVFSGSSITAASMDVGFFGASGGKPAANGTVLVSGANSTFSCSGQTTIGWGGIGNFTVQGGASARLTGDTTLGLDAGSNGTLTVDGPPAAAGAVTLTAATGPGTSMTVGQRGTGTVVVRNGGSLSVGGSAIIARDQGSTGTLTVTGVGSAASIAQQLLIGGNTFGPVGGNGRVDVTASATLAVTQSLLVIGTGTLNVNTGGTVRIGAAGGTSGVVNVNANGLLGGTGTVNGAVLVHSGGQLGPAVAGQVGRLTVGTSTWEGGGRYLFDFSSLAPNPGTANDHVNSTGALDLTATAANPFVVEIRGVNVPAPGTTPVGYTIATFAGGLTGFDPAKFAYPATGWFTTTPIMALQGNNLVLTFTPVPESAHLLVACGAAAGAISSWRRSRRHSGGGVDEQWAAVTRPPRAVLDPLGAEHDPAGPRLQDGHTLHRPAPHHQARAVKTAAQRSLRNAQLAGEGAPGLAG